jgi:hypothetical protein
MLILSCFFYPLTPLLFHHLNFLSSIFSSYTPLSLLSLLLSPLLLTVLPFFRSTPSTFFFLFQSSPIVQKLLSHFLSLFLFIYILFPPLSSLVHFHTDFFWFLSISCSYFRVSPSTLPSFLPHYYILFHSLLILTSSASYLCLHLNLIFFVF